MRMSFNELLEYISNGRPNAPVEQLSLWMQETPRFAKFVFEYRDKIRKKLRGVRDVEAQGDLLAELYAAYVILQEPRLALAYEKYGVGKARSPDFVVTFRGRLHFNLEVTRLRYPDSGANDRMLMLSRLGDTVIGKLGQTMPGMLNLLLVAPDDQQIDGEALDEAMRLLRRRAEQQGTPFLARKGFSNIADFSKHYHQLSGILLWSPQPNAIHTVWPNVHAKHKIPHDLWKILQKSSQTNGTTS